MSEQWTWNQIPDLRDKVIIVTGGNSGLGFYSVQFFAEKGATVILTSRNLEKGEKAKEKIRKKTTNGKIIPMKLDLASFKSIDDFAGLFMEKYDHLDILLNNAGVMTTPYFKTEDGLEGQIGTNHFGHYRLTGKLFPLLKKAPGARIVNVSSNAHKFSHMDFDNLLFENGKDYSPMKAYARSKLANLLFTYELQRKVEAAGLDIQVLAAHPGGSRTNLARHAMKTPIFILLFPLFILLYPLYFFLFQSAAMGALPQIRASVDEAAKGGEYYGPGSPSEIRGFPRKVESNDDSHNLEDAAKLWELSEELTGVKFDF